LDALEDEGGEAVAPGLLERRMRSLSRLNASDARPVEDEAMLACALADDELAHVVGGFVRDGVDVESFQVEFLWSLWERV